MIKIALLLAILLLAQSQSQIQPPQILYVSGSPTSIVRPASSSLVGGTLIYLKVTGHSPVASNNLVYVGTFPCIIPSDGVTDTFISCETSNSGSTAIIYNQQVTLLTNGLSFTTISPDVVNYAYYSTPLLMEVYPTAGISGSNVNLWGYHRITDLGDGARNIGSVVKLSLGNDICSTFDISQGPILGNNLQPINCKQSTIQ